MKFIQTTILPLLLLSLIFVQCVERDFSIPDLNGTSPDIDPTSIVSIQSILDGYQGSPKALPEGAYLRGIVVGDDRSGNIYKTLFIQDETAGIAIIIDQTDLFNTYYVGKEVFVKCDNLFLGEFRGLPQIGMAPNDGEVTRVPSLLLPDVVLEGSFNNNVEPKSLLLGQLSDKYLNQLIQLDNLEFISSNVGSTYAIANPATNTFTSVSLTLQNCDGATLILRNSGFSSFANTVVPGGNGTLYGILGKYDSDYQFTIRDTDDVQFDGLRCNGSSGTGGNGDGTLVEDFESGTHNNQVDLIGWDNLAVSGSRTWQFKEFDGNLYAQATAYNDTNASMDTYLVTPEVDFDVATTLQFRSATAFYTHGGLTVLYSGDYSGNPATASWTPINTTLASSSNSNYDWVDSGAVNISAFSGKGHIAFRYEGNGPGGQTNTMIIDDINVK